MCSIQVRISLKMTETQDPVTTGNDPERMGDGSFSLIIDHEDEFDISRLENAMLRTTYPALRTVLSEHLEAAGKKASEKLRLLGAGSIQEHASRYKVDGEIGRFTFLTYDVKREDQKTHFVGLDMFPVRTGQQWYQTSGFKEIGLIVGAAQRSYRQTTHVLNRTRYQEVGGTPLNTLRDGAEAEGLKVLDFMDKKTKGILKEHNFDPQGVPEAHCDITQQIAKPVYIEQQTIQTALTDVLETMSRKGFAATDIEQVEKAASSSEIYEQSEQCVYVHIDDVGVKEQKEHRDKKEVTEIKELPDDEKEAIKDKRPTVQNTVARVEQNDKGFTLTGSSVIEVLVFVLAFLLNNNLLGFNIKVCTDGQRSLQDAILSFFSWHPHVTMLLDWFHVVKKFKEDLSLACKGREIRNHHLKQLLRLVWFGLTDSARAYLEAIPATDIKNAKAITRLIGYLERNRKSMPCYAMRAKLNLPNSSNPVERSNNLVTAKRQKHHGMSWSENGSYALTSLNALIVNNAAKKWLQNRSFDLTWAAKAA